MIFHSHVSSRKTFHSTTILVLYIYYSKELGVIESAYLKRIAHYLTKLLALEFHNAKLWSKFM